jgi:hypothetical protein
LDRSWLHAPAIRMPDGDPAQYDPGQKAWLIQMAGSKESAGKKLVFSLDASEGSPAVNPAFVISGWGNAEPQVRVNGALLSTQAYRAGFRYGLEGTDLILWLDCVSSQPLTISISARK